MILIATFLTVFLLGIQQQNVIHGHYALAALTSFAIATAQFVMIRAVVTGNWYEFIMMGIGGASGITLSMWTHRKFIRKKILLNG